MSNRRSSPRVLRADWLLPMLLAVAVSPAHALRSDRDKPMTVNADSSRIEQAADGKTGTILLRGDVRISQGTMKASGAEATVLQGADGDIRTIVLTGSQAHLEQQQEGGGMMRADANRIEFDNATGVAVLTGNVKVEQQGRGEFRGAHMTYDTNTGVMEGDGRGESGRVEMILQPRRAAATGDSGS